MNLTAEKFTEADIARVRYETAHIALLTRAQRAEAALKEQSAAHDLATKELLRQLSELKKAVSDYNKMADRVKKLEDMLEEKNAALGSLYHQLEQTGAFVNG